MFLKDIKIGDNLVVNSPCIFSDLTEKQVVMVHQDDLGDLWVFSREGHHYLDEDTVDGVLFGFSIADAEGE